MVANINESIKLCGTNVHIHSISTTKGSSGEKSYYQHRHPGHEIHYIISGQCKVTCNKCTIPLQAESMLLIPPGTYHDVRTCEPNTTRLCLSFSIQKTKEAFTMEVQEKFYSAYSQSIPIVTKISNRDVQSVLFKLISVLEGTQEDPYKNDKLIALCSYLLLEMIPHIADAAPRDIPTEPEAVQEDVSFKIDSFLGTNFMHNDAKARMAENLYVSPRQLQRIIQKNYGMNYRQKLSETRVQIAMDLLMNTDMSVHKIADILGYSCSANFSAFVKRNTGKTPSQIRKER